MLHYAKVHILPKIATKIDHFGEVGLGALQTAAFITLGRIFDQKSAHNLDVLIRMAQNHSDIFSKVALYHRGQGTNPVPPEWLDDYMRDVYEPTPEELPPSSSSCPEVANNL